VGSHDYPLFNLHFFLSEHWSRRVHYASVPAATFAIVWADIGERFANSNQDQRPSATTVARASLVMKINRKTAAPTPANRI
jgi:hypothetical protein